MSKETVKIDPAVLARQVEEGMKRDELAAHYGLNISQMKAALTSQGLKIRKFHAPAFEFITSEEVVSEEVDNLLAIEAVDVITEVVTADISNIWVE